MRGSSPARMAAGASDLLHTERVLALGRVALAAASVALAWAGPGPLPRALPPLLALYGSFSLVILTLAFRAPRRLGPAVRRVYLVDLVWAVLATGGMQGQPFIFFGFFLFVIISAAYRWGFTETMRGAVMAVVLLTVQALLLWNGLALLPGVFGWTAILLRAPVLFALALFIGSLTEEQRRLRSEAATVAALVAAAQHGDFRESVGRAAEALLVHFRASRFIVTLTDAASARTVLCERVATDTGAEARVTPVTALDAGRWRLETPGRADAFLAQRRGWGAPGRARWQCWPSRSVSTTEVDGKALHGLAWTAIIGAAILEGPWSGQVLVVDPIPSQRRLQAAAFLHHAIRQASPAFHRTYLAGKLRQQAGAIERARVARDLHDGVIQTLAGLDMQLEAVRRRMEETSSAQAPALERVQAVLRGEVMNVRDLMEHLRATDIDPRHVVGHMTDLVDRFRRNTGIDATFFSDLPDPELPREVSRELLRVLQEALVNVRKHSGARKVVVRLATSSEAWSLFVNDDGRGFEFEGRCSLPELDERRAGPLVLKERVRALGGTLWITSEPGHGARLDVVIPRDAHVA